MISTFETVSHISSQTAVSSRKAGKPGLFTLLLATLTLLSGLSVIYLTNFNRQLAAELETAEVTQTQLHLEWEKLLLEQSTWSTQARIQQVAEQNLDMHLPGPSDIVSIQAG